MHPVTKVYDSLRVPRATFQEFTASGIPLQITKNKKAKDNDNEKGYVNCLQAKQF